MGFFSKLFPRKQAERALIVEQRSWVMVYDVPTDSGWERLDDERVGEDFIVQVLKLVRTDDRLVLLAKNYTGRVDDTIEDLERRDWNAQYAKVFGGGESNVRVTRTEQLLMDRKVAALDVVADGSTPDGPQRIRERYASVPGHELIVTAAGTLAAHERLANDVERWFAGIAFRPGNR